MKTMMIKTTLREIKQSFGRYIAIFAIIALGVAFFAGLKVTKSVMVHSADNYLSEAEFFDYRLLCTLGFEDIDVAELSSKEGVIAVEGAVSADIICLDATENERVLKAHSITQEVNKLVLIAGRLPQNDNECVVDSFLYTEDVIGTKIVLSDSNSPEDLDNFTYKEYTVTGLVQSPLYIQFERGTSSIGSGVISGFMYLMPSGFQMDYLTEIYVKLDADYEIYSDDYKDFIKEQDAVWESYCEAQADRRYQDIVNEAEAQLQEACDELEESKSEAQEELDDAKQELDDALKELLLAEADILDAEELISDAEIQLADAKAELIAAEKELEVKEAEILSLKEMYGDYAAVFIPGFSDAEAALLIARSELEAGKKELLEKESELNENKAELEEAKVQLEEGFADYNAGLSEYEDALSEFETEIAEAEAEIAEAREDIEAIEKPETYVLGRGTNIGYVCFENDSHIVDGIANVFPVFFFLVAALVCMTTMNRMVEEQRTQIGVLKALGYSEGTIMSKYLFYSGSAAVSGSVAGFLFGTRLFPWVMWTVYGIMYDMGAIDFVFDMKIALISLTVAILCSMGTTWFSCKNELKEVAAGLMRPKAPKAGKRVFLEYVPFVWKRLKFLHKVSVRNIVRYKKRFFMMIFGISGCTALLVTGFGIMDSITDIGGLQFGEIQLYDMSVTVTESSNTDDNTELRTLLDSMDATYIRAIEESLDFEVDGVAKNINLVVLEHPECYEEFLGLKTAKDEVISYPREGEAVIVEKLADTFDLEVGDSITLYNSNREKIEAVVSGICQNYMFNYVYLAPETYVSQRGEADFSSFYINIPEETDVHQAGADIMQVDNVTNVVVNRDMQDRLESMMSSMDAITIVQIISAGFLAFIVLYNLNNINITERIREIATIKVLGFYKKETASYVFRENTVLTAIGCMIGLLLGKCLHSYVMSQIHVDIVSFDSIVTQKSYILSILLTFVFTWIVNRFMRIKLNKINMAESLKSVD